MSKVEGRGPIVPSPPQVFVKLFFNLNSRFLGIRPDTRCNTARNIAGKVENAPPLCQLSEIVARNIAEALLYSTSVTLTKQFQGVTHQLTGPCVRPSFYLSKDTINFIVLP